MSWKKLKLGEFLINRENRFKPNDKSISGLKRIDKIDFSGKIFLSEKPSNTDMILVKKGDLVISGINVEKGAMSVYQGEEDVTATIHYSSYTFNEKKIDIDFLKLFLRSSEFKSALKEQVPGGIKTEIKPKHLLHLEVVIPNTVSEQKEVINSFSKLETQNFNLENELSHQDDFLAQLRKAFLREAMQGKLVKQDKKEGNAKELLQKIKAEKEKLIAEKKLKKEKPLLPIKAEEIPFDIPENWVWCRLGEIALHSEAGKSYQAKEISAQENQIGVIKTSAITSGFFVEEENKLLPNQNVSIDKIRIEKDDIIFCRASGSKGLAGKSCLVTNAPKAKLILSDKSIRYVFSDNISKKFIQYFNSSIFGEEYYRKLGTTKSTSMNNITREQFNNLPIPLPPLAEQKRIVKKLEELMNLCEELKTTIADNQNYTDMLLQVALKDALQPQAVEVA